MPSSLPGIRDVERHEGFAKGAGVFGSDAFGLIRVCFVMDSRYYTQKLKSVPCFDGTGHTTYKGQEHDKPTRSLIRTRDCLTTTLCAFIESFLSC